MVRLLAADWAVLLYVVAMFRLCGWLEGRERRAWDRLERAVKEREKLESRRGRLLWSAPPSHSEAPFMGKRDEAGIR